MSKIFIDTNLIIYSIDGANRKKQQHCRKLLLDIATQHHGVLSTQIMEECYAAATRKLKADPIIVKQLLHSLEHFEIVMITPELVYDAIDCSVVNQISFWDALVVVSAAHAKCQQLWTEDLSAGQIIHGVEIYHPL